MLFHLLNWLSQKFGRETDRGRSIDLHVTHQELADILGVTRVTITKTLDRLERQRLIDRRSMHRVTVRSNSIPYYERKA